MTTTTSPRPHVTACLARPRRGATLLTLLTPLLQACAFGGPRPLQDAQPSEDSPPVTRVPSAPRPLPPATASTSPSPSSLTGASQGAAVSAPGVSYRLGPGDEIQVGVFGADVFSGAYRVAESGEIGIPLLGPVPARGFTARELADTLEARLRVTYMRDPHVTVQVGEMRSHGVSVVGAVNRPGVYQIPSQSTLLEVLASAEGLAPDAGSTVHVIRRSAHPSHAPGASGVEELPVDGSIEADSALVDPGSVVAVDLGSLLESGSTAENVAIYPGDIVQVQPAGLIYVVGEVNSPGGFTIPPGRPMSVLQALAMAQGLGGAAAGGRGVIVREHDDGQREELPVDLDAILKGSEPPPTLVARDVLFVPKNGARSFVLGAVDALVRMVSLRGLVY